MNDYPTLSSDVNPDKFKRFIKHLGLAANKHIQRKNIQKRKDFVDTIGEFTDSADIKVPEINDDLRTLERKIGRSLELEQALESREKLLENKQTALEMDVKTEGELIEKLNRKINFLEKKLDTNESMRLKDNQRISKLSDDLHNLRISSINTFEAKAHAFVENKQVDSRKVELKNNLLKLEKIHKELVKAKKHDPKKLKVLEDKISSLKKLL